MKGCIFCKIVRGEAPCHKIWEDEKHLAFLSIFPNTEGFSVVITKKHYPSYAFGHAHAKLFPMHGTKMKEWKAMHSNVDKYFKKYEGYISSHDYRREDDKKLAALARKIRKP